MITTTIMEEIIIIIIMAIVLPLMDNQDLGTMVQDKVMAMSMEWEAV
jgi:hypothetical protein